MQNILWPTVAGVVRCARLHTRGWSSMTVLVMMSSWLASASAGRLRGKISWVIVTAQLLGELMTQGMSSCSLGLSGLQRRALWTYTSHVVIPRLKQQQGQEQEQTTSNKQQPGGAFPQECPCSESLQKTASCCRLFVMLTGREPSKAGRRQLRLALCCGWLAGAGSAAHCGADRCLCAPGADHRRLCAAHGERGG